MFEDATPIGRWSELAARIDDGLLDQWSAREPALSGLSTSSLLLTAWADPHQIEALGGALIRLAAIDGAADTDALLILLHLLSGIIWRLSRQLADLSPDITALAVGELTCQIRTYRWRVRAGVIVTHLERDTRKRLLAELRPTDRYHPDRVEQLSWNGDLSSLRIGRAVAEDIDILDLLTWAAATGVDADAIRLLVESECARGRRGSRADDTTARARGITRRTLLRRRERALNALRDVAPAYLAAVA